ncbi:hypothetical protein K445DRAFT_244915 [Daldinia sp. EC12]|nr:hypothetical protein K445DRAFT_244915 [Daldinia sp. EC12]
MSDAIPNSPNYRFADDEAIYGGYQIQWGQHVFFAANAVLFFHLGLCWRLMVISFCLAYYYFIFICRLLGHATQSLSQILLTIVHHILFAILLSWCVTLTPLHTVAPTLMDFWTPYTVHPAFRTTEIMYDAGMSTMVDIIAIHGLGSNPDSAWTYRMDNGSNVYWLKDLLPKSQGLGNIRVMKVNHQTRWDSNAADMGLQWYASELLDHIHSLHKANPKRPIIFIAHSFGGILLKKALLLAKARSKNVAAMTKGIIFLGVPHQGSNAAFIASCLSCSAYFRGSSTTMLELMSADGSELLDLESEFYDAYVTQYHLEDIQPYIYDIVEKRPEKIGKFVLGWIVKPKHGHLRHGRLLALDTDHRGLNKFRSHDDPNFELFLRVLGQAYDYALRTSVSPSPQDMFPPPIAPIGNPEPGPPLISSLISLPLPDIPVLDIDVLDMAVLDMSWSTMDIYGTASLYGLQELVASIGARNRNQNGSYITWRAPKLALFGSLIHSPLCSLLKLLLRSVFSGDLSPLDKWLQAINIIVLVSNLDSNFTIC